MGNPGTLWHIPSCGNLLWEEWETEYTLFNRHSGETHLINELPAQVLRLLAKQPTSAPQIAIKLARLCEVENNKQWLEQTSGIISHLASIGLIEAQSP